MKIGVISCGGANVTSVINALTHVGLESVLISKPEIKHDFLVMPGVGSFDSGISRLKSSGLYEGIKEHIAMGKPFIGICLGMQMLFNGSEEGTEKGLSVLGGNFTKLGQNVGETTRVSPNIGYNYVSFEQNKNINFSDEMEGFYYFLHSYALKEVPDMADVVGVTKFNDEVFYPFFIQENICGIQFHPERSGRRGLCLLSRVIENMSN